MPGEPTTSTQKFLDNLTGLPTLWSKITLKDSAIPMGVVDNTSTASAYTATVTGITSLFDGVCVLLKNGVVSSASGFTININSLGAKPVYTNLAAATAETTIFDMNSTLLFIYDSTRVNGGCWVCYHGSGGLATETDPVFTASAAHGITSSDITNWDAKTKVQIVRW